MKLWLFNNRIREAFRSPKWASVRKEHLIKQSQCTICGSTSKLEVHHIVPVHVDPTKELDADNLITLCDKYCHFIFGHLMNWKSWNPDIEKDVKFFHNKILKRPNV